MKAGYFEIILENKHGVEIDRAKVSNDDYDKVINYQWRIHHKKYVVTNDKDGTNISLHRLIANAKAHEIVRFRTPDTFDCRRQNLYIVKEIQVNWESKVRKDSSTGIRGVRFDKRRNHYIAEISVDGKRKYLGSFTNLYEAQQARLNAEKIYRKP